VAQQNSSPSDGSQREASQKYRKTFSFDKVLCMVQSDSLDSFRNWKYSRPVHTSRKRDAV